MTAHPARIGAQALQMLEEDVRRAVQVVSEHLCRGGLVFQEFIGPFDEVDHHEKDQEPPDRRHGGPGEFPE
jgi:hypothetical protein